MKEIKKIVKAIKNSNSFIITSHINPEGDSLGSQLAMASLLKAMNKRFIVVDNDKVPKHYAFLPDSKIISNDIKKCKGRFDAGIVLDCPNLRRTGRVKEVITNADTIINIDHHVSNEYFGDINWVKKDASCVGEMVYRLYKECKVKITKKAALYIYIAILTDTGSFNYTNTSGTTHEIISELLSYGIEPYDVSRRVYENKTIGELRLLGKVLSGLKVALDGKVAYAAARKSVFKETKTGPQACENFVNFARSIRGTDVAVFFRESIDKKNKFHVSFRSSGKADVNKIASFFGGGGHKSASGCIVYGNFNNVKSRVLDKVKSEIRRRNSLSK